jgi:hypothetical protein
MQATMTKKPADEVRKYLASLGRKGGKSRTQQMTAEERKELARKAAQARWAKASSDNVPSKQRRDRNVGEQ